VLLGKVPGGSSSIDAMIYIRGADTETSTTRRASMP
jgi:hypothetical protein